MSQDLSRLSHNEFVAKYGWPTCAVCSKPVDFLTFIPILGHDLEGFIEVRCHGQSERIHVNAVELGMAELQEPKIRLDGKVFLKQLAASA